MTCVQSQSIATVQQKGPFKDNPRLGNVRNPNLTISTLTVRKIE